MTNNTNPQTLFNIQGQTAVITGGSGALGTAMAHALAQSGAQVAILSLHPESSARVAHAIQTEGGHALAITCDITNRPNLEQALTQITTTFGPIDILINAAGGNQPQATTTPDRTFFDLDMQAIDNVFNLNFTGTFQTCQVFGRSIADRGHGCIVNIASMNALRPLTRIPAYSAAKAAIANFTQWLAVHMAQEYSPHIRVNALAPASSLLSRIAS